MNIVIFSLWLLVYPAVNEHPPVVVERFKSFQDCEEFRKEVDPLSRGSSSQPLKCIRATVARYHEQ
jgi:hypothetical protein